MYGSRDVIAAPSRNKALICVLVPSKACPRLAVNKQSGSAVIHLHCICHVCFKCSHESTSLGGRLATNGHRDHHVIVYQRWHISERAQVQDNLTCTSDIPGPVARYARKCSCHFHWLAKKCRRSQQQVPSGLCNVRSPSNSHIPRQILQGKDTLQLENSKNPCEFDASQSRRHTLPGTLAQFQNLVTLEPIL